MEQFGKRETAVMKGAVVVLDTVRTMTDWIDWAGALGVVLFLLAAARIRIRYPIVSDGLLVCVVYSIALEKGKACLHTIISRR